MIQYIPTAGVVLWRTSARFLSACLLLASVCANTYAEGSAQKVLASRFWVAALPPGRENLISIFTNTQKWTVSAGKVKYFKIYANFFYHYSDAQIRFILSTIKSLGFALAIEAPPLTESPDRASADCAKGVESYAKVNEIYDLLVRIKSLGGTVDALAMDEPIWYTMVHPKSKACTLTLVELSNEIKLQVGKWSGVFPNLKVGLIEPSPISPSLVAEFLKEIKNSHSVEINFFHVDPIWDQPYVEQIRALSRATKAWNLELGVILDVGSWSTDCVKWADDARARAASIADIRKLIEFDVIFQSWMTCPAKFEPEDSVDTLTSYILAVEKLYR